MNLVEKWIHFGTIGDCLYETLKIIFIVIFMSLKRIDSFIIFEGTGLLKIKYIFLFYPFIFLRKTWKKFYIENL